MRLPGRLHLGLADPVQVVEDLPLEVGRIDLVEVDDAQCPHPGGGQVEGGRRSEPTGPDEQDLGVEQLVLAFLAHLG